MDTRAPMTDGNQKTPRILLVRFGAMGDIIHALPAAATLRRAYPNAQIDWLVETRWRALLEESHDHHEAGALLDHVISLDTFALRNNIASRDSWRTLCAVVGQLRGQSYDVAVDLQGAIKSAIACKLSGARNIYGFTSPWLRETAGEIFYTRKVESRATHIVDANLDLAAAVIGAASDERRGTEADFPLPSGDRNTLPLEIPRERYAVLNPGAGWRGKQWPAASFFVICDVLASHYQLSTVLNCGPGEQEQAEQVRRGCKQAQPIIFSGGIPALIALLRGARLMVGPDTGPLHLAAALGVPTVGIYGPTDPARNGPYGPNSPAGIRSLRTPEARTSHRRDAPPDGSMEAISPEMVIGAIDELLAGQPKF